MGAGGHHPWVPCTCLELAWPPAPSQPPTPPDSAAPPAPARCFGPLGRSSLGLPGSASADGDLAIFFFCFLVFFFKLTLLKPKEKREQ